MGRILAKNHSYEFTALKDEAAKYGEKNDCSVVAVAMFTGCSYDTAREALANRGRINGQGVRNDIIMKALDDIGHPVIALPMDGLINAYPGRGVMLKNVTTHHPRRYPQVWEGMLDFLMISRGHIAAFVGGEIHDWSVNRALRIMCGYFRVEDREKFFEFVNRRKAERRG